jgi:hypothetical protein
MTLDNKEAFTMSPAAKTMIIFSVYLAGMGAGLVFLPNVVLGVLGFPATGEVWSRVVGVLALALAFYYVQAARSDLRPFMRWTVYTRIAVFLFFTGFVVAGLAGPMMIALGAVDLGSALWTSWALRRAAQPGRNGAAEVGMRGAAP